MRGKLAKAIRREAVLLTEGEKPTQYGYKDRDVRTKHFFDHTGTQREYKTVTLRMTEGTRFVMKQIKKQIKEGQSGRIYRNANEAVSGN